MTFSSKINSSKKARVTIRLALSFFVSLNTVKDQKVDFSGTWKLSREKTDFGKLSEKAVPIQFSVDQKKDTIVIDRITRNSKNELDSYTEKLPFNGNKIEIMTNLYTKKIASVQSFADNQLTEIAQYTDYSDNLRYSGTELWELSNTGKILTINREDKAGSHSYFRKMVYDKQ